LLLHRKYVVVTFGAHTYAGVGDILLPDVVHGRRPVMTVFSECLRD